MRRRRFVALAGVTGVGVFLPRLPVCAQTPAPIEDALAASTVFQRLCIDRFASADPVAYAALLDTVVDAASGEGAATFGQRLGALSSAAPLRSLETSLARGARLDGLIQAGNSTGTLSELAGLLVPRAGVDLAIGRELDLGALARGIGAERDLGEHLLSGATALLTGSAIRPILRAVEGVASIPGRVEAAAQGGVLGLLSSASSVLQQLAGAGSSANQRIASIVAGITDVAEKVRGFTSAISTAVSGGVASGVAAGVSALGRAVASLGRSLGMDAGVANTITRVADTVGSAVSGAIAGSAFGPIGTVVGGIVGLFTGLFGSSSGPDPTMEALQVIDRRLQAVHAEMRQSFAAVGQALSALSEQMSRGFAAVSDQLAELRSDLRDFRRHVDARLQLITRSLGQTVLSQLQTDVNVLITQAKSYSRDRVRAQLRRSTLPSDSQLTTTLARVLSQVGPGGSLSNAALVGEGLSALVGRAAEKLGRLPFDIVGTLSGVPDSGSPQSRLRQLASSLAQTCRNPSYYWQHATAWGFPENASSAELICDVLRFALEELDGIETSPEWQALTLEERANVYPRGAAAGFPASRPEHLQWLGTQLNTAFRPLADAEVLQTVATRSADALSGPTLAHALFTESSLSLALAYIQRRLALRFVRDFAQLFFHPFLVGVEVVRRAIAVSFTQGRSFGPRHVSGAWRTTPRDLADARRIYQRNGRSLLPLASIVPEPALPSALPGPVESALRSVFAAPNPRTFFQAHGMLADRLPHEIPDIDGKLRRAARSGLTLALVDTIMHERGRLAETRSGTRNRVPRFLDGLDEHIALVLRCLGEPNGPGGPEPSRARAILGAFIGPGAPVHNPRSMTGVPAQGRPFPEHIGFFWGWGAESMRPDRAVSSLRPFLYRDDMVLRDANDAVLETMRQLAALRQTAVEARFSESALDRLQVGELSGGLRDFARRHASTI